MQGYHLACGLFLNDDSWNFDKILNSYYKINIYAFIQINDFSSFLADFKLAFFLNYANPFFVNSE